jgi:hypothetical protein
MLEPLFSDEEVAAAFERRGVEFGAYRLYSEHEQIQLDIGPDLLPRHDAVRNFLRTRVGTDDTAESVAARTSYFREEYAYDGSVLAAGIEPFLHHEGLLAAARTVHGRPVIAPSIAYANVMLPGQELAVHTDVPEFRGLNRKGVPQWLLVVMHHSGLFDAWRMPIATGIAWFSGGAGGELSLWPDGPTGPCLLNPAAPNTALVLDTDTLFHGVDPVGGPTVEPPPITGDAELVAEDDCCWTLIDAATGERRGHYGWDELRLSISWKAYCFADEAEHDAWRDHSDDLTEAMVLDALVDDLRARGVIDGDPDRDRDLGLLLIDTYIRFPSPA